MKMLDRVTGKLGFKCIFSDLKSENIKYISPRKLIRAVQYV